MPDNPLIWQLSYTDAEVDKIIANRYTQAFGKPKNQELDMQHKYKSTKEKCVARMKLLPDAVWYFFI